MDNFDKIKHTDYHQKRLKYSKLLVNSKDMLPHRYCFILTNKCNLNCNFCFQERKGRKGSLNKDEWISLIDQLPEYAHVTLTGGEPLVFKGFEEVFLKVTEKHTCNIITNGLMINDKFIDLFLSRPNFQVLSISIDDIGNLNRDVKSKHWDIMLKNIDKLKKLKDINKSKLILDTKTVVLDTNSKDLFETYKFLKERLGCDTHSFQILKGSPVQHADYTFDDNAIFDDYVAHKYENFDEILNQLEMVRKYNIENNYVSYAHPNYVNLSSKERIHDQINANLLNITGHEPKKYKSCDSPWANVHVNVEGTIYPCLAVNMGNVRDNTLKEIFFGEKYNKFKETISKCGTVGACNRCGYLNPLNSF
jgi:MoaA/NifB/PqqE/SkfB family radical SAM enzyme